LVQPATEGCVENAAVSSFARGDGRALPKLSLFLVRLEKPSGVSAVENGDMKGFVVTPVWESIDVL
jgi:hypothetical protein